MEKSIKHRLYATIDVHGAENADEAVGYLITLIDTESGAFDMPVVTEISPFEQIDNLVKTLKSAYEAIGEIAKLHGTNVINLPANEYAALASYQNEIETALLAVGAL